MTEAATKQEVATLEAGADIKAIVPRTIDEVHRLAKGIIAANLAPDSYKNDPKAVAIGIMKAMEVGMPPIAGLNAIAIINGRPCIWGDGAIALIQNGGHVDSYKAEECGPLPEEGAGPEAYPDEYGYVVTITRKDQESFYVGKFTVGDAKRAKLWMNHKRPPWMLYPKRMLLNRARAFAMRDGFADALHGLSIREEMEDIPAKAPDKPDTSFLDAETVETEAAPEAPEIGTDEPIIPEVVDTEAQPEPPVSASAPALAASDYVESFSNALSHMSTEAEIENWWKGSEATRRQYDQETQQQLSALYVKRLKAIQ